MSEITKELVAVNPDKKKKSTKKAAKKAAAKVATTAKRKTKKKSSSGKGSKKKKSRKSKRTRNPGVDLAGSAASFAGGAVGYIAGQGLGGVVANMVTNKTGKKIARIAVGALVPAAAGLGAQLVAPNFGKGMVGSGGALAAAHTIAAIGTAGEKPNETLSKLGFTQLGGPDDIFERDGVLFKRMGDGTEQMLMGLNAEPIELALEDGSSMPAQLLGAFGDGEMLVMDQAGNYLRLPGDTQQMGALVSEDAVQSSGTLVQDTLSGIEDRDGGNWA